MNVFTMVVAIVAISMGTSVVLKWLKVREQHLKNSTATDKETQAVIKALEERIVVLERIVTDKNSRLKEEIDAL